MKKSLIIAVCIILALIAANIIKRIDFSNFVQKPVHVVGRELEQATDEEDISIEDNQTEAHPSSWVSLESIGSVVSLYSYDFIVAVKYIPKNFNISDFIDLLASDNSNDFSDFHTEFEVIDLGAKYFHLGSGVIVDRQRGTIISNAHVTKYSKPYVAEVENGYEIHIPVIEFIKRVLLSPNYADNLLDMDFSELGAEGEFFLQTFPDTYFMYVETTEQTLVEKNNPQISLKYLAMVVAEDTEEDLELYYRDRSVLLPLYEISLGKDNEPDFGSIEPIQKSVWTAAEMGNPFDIDIQENEVCAIGFPANGDAKRASVTKGEFLGYDNDKQSKILSNAWLSYGNSGGALFYKDKLIGINTWFNAKDSHHPVSISQPITYFSEYISYSNSDIAQNMTLWIKSDPSNDKYKKESVVRLKNCNKYDSYILCEDRTDFNVRTYFANVDIFEGWKKGIELYNADYAKYKEEKRKAREVWKEETYYWWYDEDDFEEEYPEYKCDYKKIANASGTSIDSIKYFDEHSITSINDIYPTDENTKKYFEIWKSNAFEYSERKVKILPNKMEIGISWTIEKGKNYLLLRRTKGSQNIKQIKQICVFDAYCNIDTKN